MKKLLFIFFVATIASTSLVAQENRFITVVGEASTEVEPDEITLKFTLKEEMSFSEDDETKSLDEMEAGIKKFLKEKGVKEDALTPAQPENIMGISMNKKDQRNYRLKLDKASLLKDMMKNLPVLGASKIAVVSMKSNKEKELLLEMQKKALENAKKKAENLLSVFDEKIGKVLEVSEQSSSPLNDMFGGSGMGKFYDAIFSKLMADEQQTFMVKVEYSVTVKFAIK